MSILCATLMSRYGEHNPLALQLLFVLCQQNIIYGNMHAETVSPKGQQRGWHAQNFTTQNDHKQLNQLILTTHTHKHTESNEYAHNEPYSRRTKTEKKNDYLFQSKLNVSKTISMCGRMIKITCAIMSQPNCRWCDFCCSVLRFHRTNINFGQCDANKPFALTY